MSTSQGGLRIVAASSGTLKHGSVAAPTTDADSALKPAAELGPGERDRLGNPRVKIDKVDNVMGSQAGAGSGDFHMYRGHRRTEMLRVERMDKNAAVDAADDEHAARVAAKRKECEDRTARNAAKRRKKKENKAKRDAVHQGTGGAAPLPSDGSFLARAKAQLAAEELKDASS